MVKKQYLSQCLVDSNKRGSKFALGCVESKKLHTIIVYDLINLKLGLINFVYFFETRLSILKAPAWIAAQKARYWSWADK